MKDTAFDKATTCLFGNECVDEAFELIEEQKELTRLRAVVGSGDPVCPICKAKMEKERYKGYYENFVYWSCECEKFDDCETVTGSYA